jgi:F-type H+-transporting ATPase subunit a
MAVLRNLDLVLLALALPVFLIAGLPPLGWVTGAVLWSLWRGIGEWSDRRVAASTSPKETAGIAAGSMVGRGCLLTGAAMMYIANRMAARPNRVQTAVETLYLLMRDNIARGNMDDRMARKWFPFVGTLFLFIWISNLIGYIPLPTNDHEPVTVFGIDVPAFALYAATANISVPLALTLMVWFAYHFEGIREMGLRKYLASWIPAGTPAAMRPVLFVIEAISHFVRIISLSVRLFANILAGHLLILFMAGGLAVILGLSALGVVTLPVAIVFFLFEVGLVATLQAFIFATLTAIYLGGATSEHH